MDKLEKFNKKKKIFSVLMLFIMLTALITPAVAAENELHIVSTADMHGNIFKNIEKRTIGYGNIYSIKNSVDSSVVVDAGDFLGDTAQKKTVLNENIIYAMNESGYDYVMLGEAEAKYKYEELNEIMKNARFKILCSNALYNGEKVFYEEQIKEADGIKIGVFGVSEEIEGNNYTYEDPIKAAKDSALKLRNRGAKVIVALVYSKTGELAEKIAQNVSDITTVVEGGTHEERKQGTLINNRTLVTNTGSKGNSVNVTKLKFTNSRLASFETTNYNLDNIEEIYPEMNELEEKMEMAQGDITAFTQNIIGKLDRDLLLESDIFYTTTPLGNFLCDVIKEKTKADVVILNSKNITGGLSKNVTQAQINNLFEKNNNVTLRRITGKSLYIVVEIAINKIVADEKGNIDKEKSQSDRFMQISGMTVKYNPSNEPGERIVNLYVGDKEIRWFNEKDEYMLASTQDVFEETNEYLAALDIEKNYGDVSDIISEYMEENKDNIKISEEIRAQTTDEQKSYLWVVGLIAGGFIVVLIVIFIIAKTMLYFAR